jgi:hypothetical protein
MRSRGWILAALLAGCSTPDLPPLPAGPPPRENGEEGTGDPELPPSKGIETSATDPGVLTPSVEGEEILPGVVLLEPSSDVSAGVATFSVRNDTGRDLPDLILSVVFAVTPPGGKGNLHPRFESIEAPLRKGEKRFLRVGLASLAEGEKPVSFRVTAGLPEVLAARGADGQAGTTFMGGLLECVRLEADLVGQRRVVVVGLAGRPSSPGDPPLPRIEAQLLVSRAGVLQWTGPWILVPTVDGPEGERRIQWNLDAAPGLAACELFLRVREKR